MKSQSVLCYQSAVVHLFRELASRFLEARCIVPGEGIEAFQRLEVGLFENPIEALDFQTRTRVQEHFKTIDFIDISLESLGDLFNELQMLRLVVRENGDVVLANSGAHKKQLGSYFTHPRLTSLIAEGIVDGLIQKVANGEDWKTFTFCDNSCGSGHILRRLIEHLSLAFRDLGFFDTQADARRWFAENATYGIDRDPHAVWLTRLGIALQTAEHGKPLAALNDHIVLGDALESTIDWSDQGFSYARVFPEVFKHPDPDQRGFTVIAGNPPWETIEPRIQDFYKMTTGFEKAGARADLDVWLSADIGRREDYRQWVGKIQAYAAAIKASGYSQKSKKVFTYAYFIERSLQTLKPGGLLSYIVKLGLTGDLEVTSLRSRLFEENHMKAMWIFRSNRIDGVKIFPRIDPNEKFVLFEATKESSRNRVFKGKHVKSLGDLNRVFKKWQCYDFLSSLDRLSRVEIYETPIQKQIAQQALSIPTLKQQGKIVTQELNVTNHRHLFHEDGAGVPIYRGEDLKPFRVGTGRYSSSVREKIPSIPTAFRDRIGVNDIVPNSRRKMKAAMIPANTLTANSILVIDGFCDGEELNFTLGALNSFLTEFVLRPRLSNMHINVFRLQDLPVPTDLFLKKEIAAFARSLQRGIFDEGREEYIAIEALMGEAYGLGDADVRAYLASFEGVGESYIQDVIDFRKSWTIRKSG